MLHFVSRTQGRIFDAEGSESCRLRVYTTKEANCRYSSRLPPSRVYSVSTLVQAFDSAVHD